MTIGWAILIGILLGNSVSILMVARRVRTHIENDPHGKPEENWNNAVRNLHREWDTWKVNRAQDFQSHSEHVDRRITELRDHLRNHVSADHLHENRGNGDDR